MTIREIIEKGEEVKKNCYKRENAVGGYVSGPAYADWLALASMFLRESFPKHPDTERFCDIASRANGRSVESYDALMGILKAFEIISPRENKPDIEYILGQVFSNFHKCATNLRNRHANRNTIELNDEYDVQDLLYSILKLFVKDLRTEDYVPSYAGSNSRIDFYLPEYEMFIETKMTRASLKDKEIGEELTIDVARYKGRCKKLICFIYDKASLLSNPYGLKNDLEQQSDESMKVEVLISPQ